MANDPYAQSMEEILSSIKRIISDDPPVEARDQTEQNIVVPMHEAADDGDRERASEPEAAADEIDAGPSAMPVDMEDDAAERDELELTDPVERGHDADDDGNVVSHWAPASLSEPEGASDRETQGASEEPEAPVIHLAVNDIWQEETEDEDPNTGSSSHSGEAVEEVAGHEPDADASDHATASEHAAEPILEHQPEDEPGLEAEHDPEPDHAAEASHVTETEAADSWERQPDTEREPEPEHQSEAEHAPDADDPQGERVTHAQPEAEHAPASMPEPADPEPAEHEPEADAPAGQSAEPAAEAEHAPSIDQAPTVASNFEPVEESAMPTMPPSAAVQHAPAEHPAATVDADMLLSAQTEQASRAALAPLAGLAALTIRPDAPEGTLDALVRDMLRPMLGAWLDEHLPAIVERLVSREVRRITGD